MPTAISPIHFSNLSVSGPSPLQLGTWITFTLLNANILAIFSLNRPYSPIFSRFLSSTHASPGIATSMIMASFFSISHNNVCLPIIIASCQDLQHTGQPVWRYSLRLITFSVQILPSISTSPFIFLGSIKEIPVEHLPPSQPRDSSPLYGKIINMSGKTLKPQLQHRVLRIK